MVSLLPPGHSVRFIDPTSIIYSRSMTTSAPLRLGTKSIRSKADLEEYVRHFNRDDKVEYTAYYAKDAVVSTASYDTIFQYSFLTLAPTTVQIQWFPRPDRRRVHGMGRSDSCRYARNPQHRQGSL